MAMVMVIISVMWHNNSNNNNNNGAINGVINISIASGEWQSMAIENQ